MLQVCSPYNPTCHEIMERFNHTLKEIVKKNKNKKTKGGMGAPENRLHNDLALNLLHVKEI